MVVRTAKKIQRSDGSVVKFDDNACVLINKAGEPIGTRLNGAYSHLRSSHKDYVWRAEDIQGYGRRERTETDECGALGIVGNELRKTKWSKILSLAPMHL